MRDRGATSAPFVSRRGVATKPSQHMDSMRKRGECQGNRKKNSPPLWDGLWTSDEYEAARVLVVY